MDFINSTNSTNILQIFESVQYLRVISLIGIIQNLTTFILMINKGLNLNFYKILRSRLVINLFKSILGVVRVCECLDCPNSYEIMFFMWYIYDIPLRMLFRFSFLSQVYMTVTIFYMISARENCFTRSSRICTVYFVIYSFVLLAINYLSVELVSSNGLYVPKENGFSLLGFYDIEKILTFIALIIVYILTFLKYRNATKTLTVSPSVDVKFTKMALILTSLSIFDRSFDLFLMGLKFLRANLLIYPYIMWINVEWVTLLSKLVTTIISTFESIIYFLMDRKLSQRVKIRSKSKKSQRYRNELNGMFN